MRRHGLGTATGAAFIAGGQPLRGASGWAGELGHLPVMVGDTVRRLDSLAGDAVIARDCGLPAAQVAARAGEGGPRAPGPRGTPCPRCGGTVR